MRRTPSRIALLLLLGLGLTGAEAPSCGGFVPIVIVEAACEDLNEHACAAAERCAPEYSPAHTQCGCAPCVDPAVPCPPCPCPRAKTFVACHDKQARPCASLGEAGCLARQDCLPIYAPTNPPTPFDAGEGVSCTPARKDSGGGPVPPARDGGSGVPVADGGSASLFLYCKDVPKPNCPPLPCAPCPDGGVPNPIFGENGCQSGCTCEPAACPPVCELYCPNGHVRDAKGCELCECNPTKCAPPAPCPFCPNGYVTDEKGCQTCECRPSCPDVICALYCEKGFQKDENGCNLCACNPPCSSDAQCPAGQFCQHPVVECLVAPCPELPGVCVVQPAGCTSNAQCAKGEVCSLPIPNCPADAPCAMELGTCRPLCSADADCASGFTCQPDPNDPCNGGKVKCLLPGREVCLPAPKPAPTDCTADDQCPAGQVCQRPVVECLVAPCPELPGTCVPKSPNCTSDAECAKGEVCSLPIPNCPADAPCAMELGTCRPLCSADAECASGFTCQPDPNDPCNGGKVKCLLPGREVCLPAPACSP